MTGIAEVSTWAGEPSGLGLVWFRNDLRLEDNPAWSSATSNHKTVAALYVVDPQVGGVAGSRRRRRNAEEVRALDRQLRSHGGCLTVRTGRPEAVVAAEVQRLGAVSLYLNSSPGPGSSRRDELVAKSLPRGVDMHSFWGNLVQPPGSLQTRDGHVPHVFTSFWKRWTSTRAERWPDPRHSQILAEPGEGLDALYENGSLGPVRHGHPERGTGSDGAHELLERFVTERVGRYPEDRDSVTLRSTSELSIALHFGTISPRTVVDAASGHGRAGEAFIRQIAWRDWYSHLLFENPRLVTQPMRPEYDDIEWRDDPVGLRAWKDGRTGFPIVDAAMRQLAATGRMHNRARLIAASFLVKDLLIDWRHGERHFRRHLLDGDLAQNVGNWQWVAGVGPDAAPYFRVFNPTRQAEAHDPHGDFVRAWVPELRRLPTRYIHAPLLAPPGELKRAGVNLGREYPQPIVDHAVARDRALVTYKAARARAITRETTTCP